MPKRHPARYAMLVAVCSNRLLFPDRRTPRPKGWLLRRLRPFRPAPLVRGRPIRRGTATPSTPQPEPPPSPSASVERRRGRWNTGVAGSPMRQMLDPWFPDRPDGSKPRKAAHTLADPIIHPVRPLAERPALEGSDPLCPRRCGVGWIRVKAQGRVRPDRRTSAHSAARPQTPLTMGSWPCRACRIMRPTNLRVRGDNTILVGQPHSAEYTGYSAWAPEVQEKPLMACRNGLTKSPHSKSILKAFGAVMAGAHFGSSPGGIPSASGEGMVNTVDVSVLEGTPASAFVPSFRRAGKRAAQSRPAVFGLGGVRAKARSATGR